MGIETQIKKSEWWRLAGEMPDRHYDPSAGVYLTEHLEATVLNLRFLSSKTSGSDYFSQLREALVHAGIDPTYILETIKPAALLHDIGKTREDKTAEVTHPITDKAVKMRHPIVSLTAALELLPESMPGRNTILALIEEHDTPYSWFMQFQKSGQIPKRKSWAKLDRKIDGREDGTGLVLLSVLKLADIDGHENVEDVPWFFEQANNHFLREKGKWLPVPDQEDVRRLQNTSGIEGAV